MIIISAFFLLCVLLLNKCFSIKNEIQLLIAGISVLVFFIYGFYNAQQIKINNIEFTSNKISKNYNIVYISDLHIGSESTKFLNKIVDKINLLNPDVLLITGDLIDNENIQLKDIEVLKKIKVPIYFTYGNHEYIHDKVGSVIQKALFLKVLDNNVAKFDELEIIGINSYSNFDHHFGEKNIEILVDKIKYNNSKYLILLNHDPLSIQKIAQRNFDLMLAGHTHGGQFFPFNLLIKFWYKYSVGLHRINNMDLYITSGAGTWGPNIRVGTKNEIVHLKLKPKE